MPTYLVHPVSPASGSFGEGWHRRWRLGPAQSNHITMEIGQFAVRPLTGLTIDPGREGDRGR
jgi:hypothetical protein